MATATKTTRQSTTGNSGKRPNLVGLRAAALATLAKAAADQYDAADLEEGAAYDGVTLEVSAIIGGLDYRQSFEADTTIGHASSRAGSSTPKIGLVIAAILGKMNAKTRAAVTREIIAEFESGDERDLDVSEAAEAAANEFLAALRQTKVVQVRPAVKVKSKPAATPAVLRVVRADG